MQLKLRPINVCGAPIVLDERKELCLNEVSYYSFSERELNRTKHCQSKI